MSEHGAWGSSEHHQRYMEPIDPKRRRRCLELVEQVTQLLRGDTGQGG
jgi:hypothetical protein